MTTTTWILQGLLGFVFFMAGLMKLVQPREKVIASGGKWAEDFSPKMIKIIGVAELLIADALVLPRLLGLEFAGYATVGAAIAAMAVMVGAFVTHVRRKETPLLAVTGVIFLLAGALAWLSCPSCHS